MADDELYVTITGAHYYFGMPFFTIGQIVTLQKEPENLFDGEAIAVMAPVVGKVGYVANSPQTMARGTQSAGRIYDHLPTECAAIVLFITCTKIIAKVMPGKKAEIRVEVRLADNDPLKVSEKLYSDFKPSW